MTCSERVVRRLCALGKTRNSTGFTEGRHPVATASDNLMGIGLMTDIPNETVMWGVEDIMQCNCELNDTKRCAKMAAGVGDGAENLPTKFVGKLLEVSKRKALEIFGVGDGVKQGCGAWSFVLWRWRIIIEGGDGG